MDAERLEVAQAKSDLLPAELTLQRKAGEEGRLFGSVAALDVVDSLTAMGITVQRSEVSMPNGPIKEIGEHTIEVILHAEVRKTLDVKVELEQE